MSTIMAYDKDGNESPVKVHHLVFAMRSYNSEEEHTCDFVQYAEDKFEIYGLNPDWFETVTYDKMKFITLTDAGIKSYLDTAVAEIKESNE